MKVFHYFSQRVIYGIPWWCHCILPALPRGINKIDVRDMWYVCVFSLHGWMQNIGIKLENGPYYTTREKMLPRSYFPFYITWTFCFLLSISQTHPSHHNVNRILLSNWDQEPLRSLETLQSQGHTAYFRTPVPDISGFFLDQSHMFHQFLGTLFLRVAS